MLLIVAVLSLIPLPQEGIGVDDKLSHLIAYGVLAGWFSLLARNQPALVWVVTGLVLFGIGIEILQSLTDYRYAEWGDVIANTIGALLGACLYYSPAVRILVNLDRRLSALIFGQ